MPICCALLVLQFFFVTGHEWSLSSLQIEAAFIGFEQFNYWIGATLLSINTFAACIMGTIGLAIMSLSSGRQQETAEPDAVVAMHRTAANLLLLVGFFATTIMLTAIFVYIERRHLMMWRVFAPKYVFDTMLVLVIDVLVMGVLIALVLVVRFSTTDTRNVKQNSEFSSNNSNSNSTCRRNNDTQNNEKKQR
jgi:GPI ethanolamine phosphate transferase 3 subunit O